MFPIPPNETLVETKVCKHCGISFPITDKDMEFYEKVSPTFGGKKYMIPPPTLCPDCRQQRRLSFRNERKLYKRTCDFSGKDIISIYSPDKPFKVYHQDYWWSDKWNPMDYGREFDFGRSAMEQMNELLMKVPQLWLIITDSVEVSPYTNYTDNSRNIYMCSDVFESENILYSTTLKYLKDCIDCIDLQNSENCYECNYSSHISQSSFVIFSQYCSYSKFIHTCSWIHHSLFCVWIKDQGYRLLNKPISEEYYNTIIKLPIYELKHQFLDQYQKLITSHIRKESMVTLSEYSVWDNLISCYQVSNVFDASNVKYSKYVLTGYDMESAMDTTIHNINCLYDYEAISWGKLVHSAYNILWWWGQDLYYNICAINSSHLFWCVGLRNASYCILNRQYSREEYEILVPKIIEHMMTTGEWGEFFPSSLSPFGYNETVAQEYFSISSPQPSPKGEGASETENKETFRKVWISSPPSPSGEGVRGWGGNGGFWGNWSLYEPPFPKVDKIIPASKLPDDITKIPDDILNWAIECEVTGKPFRIIPQELEFYRKHHLPIPRRHPDQRHLDRMKMRNPRKLYERVCDCPECEINNKTSLSSFSPNENSFGTRERDSPTENDKETVDTFVLNPRTGKKGKKMITTYAPERSERVYCEVCYEKEVVG